MHRYDNTEQVHLAVLSASIAEERSKISGNFMPFGAERVPGDCRRIQFNEGVSTAQHVHCHHVWVCIALRARAPSDIVNSKECSDRDYMRYAVPRVECIERCRKKRQNVRDPLL